VDFKDALDMNGQYKNTSCRLEAPIVVWMHGWDAHASPRCRLHRTCRSGLGQVYDD